MECGVLYYNLLAALFSLRPKHPAREIENFALGIIKSGLIKKKLLD